jgi:hypothetical protein
VGFLHVDARGCAAVLGCGCAGPGGVGFVERNEPRTRCGEREERRGGAPQERSTFKER